MPFCDECGNEVSKTDKRCSKCGNMLTPPSTRTFVDPTPVQSWWEKIRHPEYHNIELILALIGVVFSVLAIPDSSNSYIFTYSNLFLYIIISLFVAVIGAIIIRYHAKIGAVILLISGFALILFGVQGMYFALIFYILAVILAFVRN